MRRILAALAAVAMVAAGFAVRRSLDDPQRGKEPLVLACVAEAEAACMAIERADVVVRTPAQIEKELESSNGQSPYDAVVTAAPWPDRLTPNAPARAFRADVGSSKIVEFRRQSAGLGACKVNLGCLAASTERVAFPPVETSTAGAIVAAATMASAGIDDRELTSETSAAEAVIRQLDEKREVAERLNVDPLTILTTTSLLDSVIGLANALPADTPSVRATAVNPEARVQLELLAFSNDERLRAAEQTIRRELAAGGWDAGSGSGIPPVALMSATYARLKG